MIEMRQRQSQSRLQTRYPEGRPVKLQHLFVGVVWSMVSRNAIDGSIHQPLDHSSNVVLGAKRGTHLCIGVVSRAGSIGQREMVRRNLASSMDSLTLGSTNQFQCFDG